MDLSLIQGTISGLKVAGDLAKGLLDLKSLADVQGRVIDLQSAILAAQSSALSANADQAAMAEEIRTLKEALAKAKAWEIEKLRYKLVSPWEGAVLYALKQSQASSEPPHYLCTRCYGEGRKSILNSTQSIKGRGAAVCPVCKSEVQSAWVNVPVPQYTED
jgi:superfamily II helicase